MLGFAEKLFCQSFGTPSAKRNVCRADSCGRKNNQNLKSNHMTVLTAKGNWNIAKGKLKQKFAQLTNDDLQFTEGKQDELTGRIQKRSGETRENNQPVGNTCCTCKQ